MGCNFYLIKNRCKHCGRSDEPIYLGKSSMGWKFTLQANDFEYYKDWPGMKKWLGEQVKSGEYIRDEYLEIVTLHEFITLVEGKQTTKDPQELNVDFATIVDGYKFYNCVFS